jgi:hypothetical protein
MLRSNLHAALIGRLSFEKVNLPLATQAKYAEGQQCHEDDAPDNECGKEPVIVHGQSLHQLACSDQSSAVDVVV